jgi:hypothetical protein
VSNILAVTYESAFAPTKSDTLDDPNGTFAAFYVGSTGDVKVHTVNGQDVTFVAVQAGTGIPIAHTRVWLTGTGAGSILCLAAMPYKQKGAVQK